MSQDPQIGAEPADFLFDTEEFHTLADGALIGKALRHAYDMSWSLLWRMLVRKNSWTCV